MLWKKWIMTEWFEQCRIAVILNRLGSDLSEFISRVYLSWSQTIPITE